MSNIWINVQARFLLLSPWKSPPKDRLFITAQGPVSRKSRELFGPEKPFDKVRPAYSVKLVFSYVAKGIKKKNCKVSCLETPSF